MLLPLLLTLKHLVPPTLSIIGGKPADPDAFPFLVNIVHRDDPFYRCGGVIYDKLHIITSAICVKNDPIFYDIIAADYNVGCSEGIEVVRAIYNVTYLDEWEVGDEPGKNDLAIVRLTEELYFKDNVFIKPATFAKPPFTFPTQATLVGWGQVNNVNGPRPDLPSSADLKVTANTLCEIFYPELLKQKGVVCYGDEHTSGCGQDIGGPLICEPGPVVCAIFNTARECGLNGLPGVLTSIPEHYGFIQKHTFIPGGRSMTTTDPKDVKISSCGGYYDTTSGVIQLQGLSAGQKCIFAIRSPLEKFSLKVTETTLLKQDGIYVTVFCLADPCRRWKMENHVGYQKDVRSNLILITVTISPANPKLQRGLTLAFKSSGVEKARVPSLTGFTVLNSSTPSTWSYPLQGGEYRNNELVLVVFDMPKEFTITMTRMDLEGMGNRSSCLYDAVSIFTRENDRFHMKARLCGNKLPSNTFNVPKGFSFLSFISDDNTVGKGFEFEYK